MNAKSIRISEKDDQDHSRETIKLTLDFELNFVYFANYYKQASLTTKLEPKITTWLFRALYRILYYGMVKQML